MPAPGATADDRSVEREQRARTARVGTRGPDPHTDRNGGIRDQIDQRVHVGVDGTGPRELDDEQRRVVGLGLVHDPRQQRGIGRVEQAVDLHDRDAVQVGRGVVALRGSRLRQMRARGPAVRDRATSGFVYRRMTSRLS